MSGEKVRLGTKKPRRPTESILREEKVDVDENSRLEDLCSTVFGHEPRTRLQNSSTMDSGVEDCCESNQAILLPPSPSPCELEEGGGRRYTLRMVKGDEVGFGFSVVWVCPPR